jgi:hypothetical protein
VFLTAGLCSYKASSPQGPELKGNPHVGSSSESNLLTPTGDARPGKMLTQPYQQKLESHDLDTSREQIALDLFTAESARTKNPLGGEFCFWPKILKVSTQRS